MRETVLIVDDDACVLSAMQRTLYKDYRVEIAGTAKDALDAMAENSYAVVVSDLRMPGTNGAEFLAQVKLLSPETVRILLTGHADLEAAILAVNEGGIFRILTKPCPRTTLVTALEAALEQYRLVNAERELLEETLVGTVEVLIDVLSTIQPVAFGRASRVRCYVRHLARELGVPDVWQLEAAAMLSHIGSIAVNPDVLRRYYAGETLQPEETVQVQSQALVSRKLLRRIPRLQAVAEIIEHQHDAPGEPSSAAPREFLVSKGAQILRTALEFERLRCTGQPAGEALESMRTVAAGYDADVLAALARVSSDPALPEAAPEDSGCSQILTEEQKLFWPLADEVMRSLKESSTRPVQADESLV